ncbi:MAG: flagellar biosynthesis anti-sigma factor FlgM [Desulfovibrio sp.]|jgi:anti-sigma28 factor (negative regulator of flagellin synthesis)|nr:flagellar biosynthesis anti-sigma factor FlgM [Desulfovibrio sp.]MBI4959012.1 flagellar biosynthesis anti-sigma factor FlgM [Desulfovibrio sp.]
MNHDKKLPDGNQADPPLESPEERARRVADIKRRVAQGKYLVNGREILYNMLKTAP